MEEGRKQQGLAGIREAKEEGLVEVLVAGVGAESGGRVVGGSSVRSGRSDSA